MKNGPLVTAAAVLITAGGAFIAGRASAPSSESAAGIAAAETVRPPRTDRGQSSLPEARAASRSTSDRRAPAARSESADQEMKRIMGTVDPLARTQAWLDFVNTLDPSEFESVVAEFRGSGFTRENMGEYAMLLTAWAGHDPLSALDYAKENTGNSFARNTILATWVTSDPDAAIAWAEQNHEGDDANPWMVGVIRGLAAYDPERASGLLNEMPRSRERGDALGAVLPAMLAQGADVAKNWALNLADDSLREGAIGRLTETLAREDPAGTVEWLVGQPDNATAASIDNAVGTWTRQDPAAATAFYEAMPAGEARSNALRGITNQMAMSDPRAAADFLDSHAADANDRVYQQFVWHSFREDPAVAAEFIGRIQDPGQQEGMYRRMLDNWLRRDFDAAAGFIQSTNLPENVRNRFVDATGQVGSGG